MPTMLGLTTDPSPHAMSDQQQQVAKSDKPRRGNPNTQMTKPNGRNESNGANGNPKPKKQASSSIAANASGKPDSNTGARNSDGERNNTISSRNQAAGLELETLFWRAMCDEPRTAVKYLADDAVMSNPLFFGDASPKAKDSQPSIKEALEDSEPYLGFKIHNPRVVEIDLMAVTTVYAVSVFRSIGNMEEGDGRFETIEATASSSWRQVAGGDWELVSNHVAYAS